MNRHVRWLREQLLLWVAQGVVSPAQADRIRGFYPEPKAGALWGTIIFAGLGAVVFGLGVILLFAYNWRAIPKAGKLAVIFLSILAAHGAGRWLLAKPGWQRPVGEALAVLGTMLYGAGIWLVAQLYHIQEHYPNGFLFWALGALALAWAMPSVAQGVLAVVLLCIWSCSEAWGFARAMHAAPLLLLVAGGGLAWRLRSVPLLVLVLAGFTLTLLAAAGSLTSDLVLPVWLCVAAAFLAVGRRARRGLRFPRSGTVWEFFGWLGFLFSLYLLTFPDLVEHALDWARETETEALFRVRLYAWAAFATGVVAWLPRLIEVGRQRQGRWQAATETPEEWLVPLTVVLLHIVCVTESYRQEWVVAGVFNLVFLALAAMWMGRGCRSGLVGPTVLGSLLFVALAVARYFDLFESLLVRGLMFLLVGAVLFAEGLLFTRARRRAKKPEGGA